MRSLCSKAMVFSNGLAQDWRTTKMNPEIKVLWLDRLESGKEKQGTGALKKVYPTKNGKVRKVRHCCLGVLWEIAK